MRLPQQLAVQGVMPRQPRFAGSHGVASEWKIRTLILPVFRRDHTCGVRMMEPDFAGMSRLSLLPAELRRSLEQRSALKVIAGLMNFDQANVAMVAAAAGRGGADLIDVACDAQLVKLAIEASSGVPVCVSAVDPELFPAALAAGAAMVEIGNYDAFYPQGRIFDAAEVLAITRRTRALLPDVVMSVTVPHVLPLDQQEQLAVDWWQPVLI